MINLQKNLPKPFIPVKSHQQLLPCPFCGYDKPVYDPYDSGVGLRWRVVCPNCMANIDPGYAQNTHVVQELWNRRAKHAPFSAMKPKTLAIHVLDIVEDMLDEKDVTIPDDDRLMEPNECRLYGATYGDLIEQIADLFEHVFRM